MYCHCYVRTYLEYVFTTSRELSIVSEIKDCSYKNCDLSAICQTVFVAFQRALYVGVLTKQFGQSVALNIRLFF